MPLIILAGHPCSGKTHRAKQLVAYLEEQVKNRPTTKHETSATENGKPSTASTIAGPPKATANAKASAPFRIHLISDHTLHIPRSAYATARAEKDARAALYSAVKRDLSPVDVVVLDAGNYIKGWRYQLYCEAKAVRTTSCVVYVGVTADKAREVHRSRKEASDVSDVEYDEKATYDDKVFEELLMRFEEPNPMARWDAPCYPVPWDDDSPPFEQIWNEVVEPPKDGKKGVVVRPNMATVLTPAAPPDHLYELDRITSAVLTRIQEHLRDNPEGGTVSIAHESGPPLTIELPATPPSFPQLQRLRRQFIALHRQQMGAGGVGAIGATSGSGMRLEPKRIRELFVDWLNDGFE